MRRVTRLEPPYIASTVVAILAFFLYYHKLVTGGVPHVLASIFYLHNLVFGQMSSVNPVAWSLEVEIQFYVLAPLVMQCYCIRRTRIRRALLLVSILCISLAQMPFEAVPRVNLSILFHLQYFLMGLLVADVFTLDIEAMKSSWIWDVAGIVALGAIFWPAKTTYWPHALMPIPIGVLCVAAMRSLALRRVFANQWIAVVGGMCYSIYLLHFLFIASLWKVTKRAVLPDASFVFNYAIQLLLLTVPVVTVCAVFFILVERPCMDPNWPSKLWHRFTGRQQSEVALLDAGGISS
jgi:peptidoglycan/LPS O-acetylase OafA/YrhL